MPRSVEEELSVSQVARKLQLSHLEVNRRIHKGQIPARKVGWFWVIKAKDLIEVKEADWYKNAMKRRAASSSA